jgi:hypothetical protein
MAADVALTKKIIVRSNGRRGRMFRCAMTPG